MKYPCELSLARSFLALLVLCCSSSVVRASMREGLGFFLFSYGDFHQIGQDFVVWLGWRGANISIASPRSLRELFRVLCVPPVLLGLAVPPKPARGVGLPGTGREAKCSRLRQAGGGEGSTSRRNARLPGGREEGGTQAEAKLVN